MSSADSPVAREPILPDFTTISLDPAFVEFAALALGGSELADGLAPGQLARLATIGEMRAYAADDLICDEHERGDELYIVGSGSVEVWLNPASVGDTASAPRKIADLRAGQTCGELALLDGGVRSAELRAGSHGARLMAFKRTDLLELCDSDTAIGYLLMRNLAGALALRLRVQDMRLYSI